MLIHVQPQRTLPTLSSGASVIAGRLAEEVPHLTRLCTSRSTRPLQALIGLTGVLGCRCAWGQSRTGTPQHRDTLPTSSPSLLVYEYNMHMHMRIELLSC